jgi:hypothetical protein
LNSRRDCVKTSLGGSAIRRGRRGRLPQGSCHHRFEGVFSEQFGHAAGHGDGKPRTRLHGRADAFGNACHFSSAR